MSGPACPSEAHGSRRAFVVLALGALCAVLLTPSRCLSGVIVLRPDGSGDVPTFQAGVDAILADQGPCEPDTLLVEPGRYDEVVTLYEPTCPAVILCPAGAERTRLRGVQLPEDHLRFALVRIQGLTIEESVYASSNLLFYWVDCRFAGGFEWHCFCENPTVEHCTFNGRVVFDGINGYLDPPHAIQDCRFEQAVVYVRNHCGTGALSRCTFEGPGDTAVVVIPGDESPMQFGNCTFRGYRVGVAMPPVYEHELDVLQSSFEDIAGPAIVTGPSPQPPAHRVRPFRVLISDSRFERCGHALLLDSGSGSQLEMSRDTVRNCTDVGVSAIVGRAQLEDLDISDCGSSGAEIWSVPSYYVGVHEHLHMMRATFRDNGGFGFSLRDTTGEPGFVLSGDHHEVVGCTFAHNAWGGLYLRTDNITIRDNVSHSNGGDGIGFEDHGACPDSLVRNTSALNGGDGIRCLAAPDQEPCRILADASERLAGADQGFSRAAVIETDVPDGHMIENNLVAGNAGAGLAVSFPPDGAIRWNDAWMNLGNAYAGFAPGAENLTLDPQFCDALAGDFHVQEGSPCAPSGPYGQIGALGAACEVSRVAIEVDPPGHAAINLNSNAPVAVAVLSNPVFDASAVDLGSITFAGAAPSTREPGVERPRVEDVNGDGQADLVVTFRARDLHLDPGATVAVLEGQTLTGTRIQGSQTVQVRDGPIRGGSNHPEGLTLAPFLSVSVNGGLVVLDYALSAPDRVDLAVFDVAGRQVATIVRHFQSAGHQQAVWDSEGLPSGMYFARLRTGRVARIASVLILR
jgi:hypothetical protein